MGGFTDAWAQASGMVPPQGASGREKLLTHPDTRGWPAAPGGGAIPCAGAKIRDLPTVLGAFSFTGEREAEVEPVVQVVSGGAFVVLP